MAKAHHKYMIKIGREYDSDQIIIDLVINFKHLQNLRIITNKLINIIVNRYCIV